MVQLVLSGLDWILAVVFGLALLALVGMGAAVLVVHAVARACEPRSARDRNGGTRGD